jgi:hypothetical protein
MAESLKVNLTANQVQEEMSPLVLDLIALFNIIQEDIYKSFIQGVKEGKRPEQIINEIEEKI